MNPQIQHNFKYHPPQNKEEIQAHENVRMACRNLAELLDQIIPSSREKSLMFTKLEETMMWANAAIARNKGDN